MRKLRRHEQPLIAWLLKAAGIERDLDHMRVEEMDDGGMGSLRFICENASDRKFGSCSAEIQFRDADGTDAIASLYLDQEGELLEMDLWKVDFSSLTRWPKPEDLGDTNHT